MAYLAKATGDVMDAVKKHHQEREVVAIRAAPEAEAKRQQQAAEAREAELVAKQERAFTESFPGAAQQRACLSSCFVEHNSSPKVAWVPLWRWKSAGRVKPYKAFR
jgi:hypothetical protein